MLKATLIGIGGPSCAGKGEIAAYLSARLAAPILDFDGYYREQSNLTYEQRCLVNYDRPEAIDTDLLFAQVGALAAGEDIYKPVYSFERHTRDTQTAHFQPARWVIVEGLFTLYWPELRALYSTAIYIEAPDEVCLERRIDRDTRTRGRTEEEVRRRFREHVQPAAREFIRPTRQYAGLVLDGTRPIRESGERVLSFLGA